MEEPNHTMEQQPPGISWHHYPQSPADGNQCPTVQQTQLAPPQQLVFAHSPPQEAYRQVQQLSSKANAVPPFNHFQQQQMPPGISWSFTQQSPGEDMEHTGNQYSVVKQTESFSEEEHNLPLLHLLQLHQAYMELMLQFQEQFMAAIKMSSPVGTGPSVSDELTPFRSIEPVSCVNAISLHNTAPNSIHHSLLKSSQNDSGFSQHDDRAVAKDKQYSPFQFKCLIHLVDRNGLPLDSGKSYAAHYLVYFKRATDKLQGGETQQSVLFTLVLVNYSHSTKQMYYVMLSLRAYQEAAFMEERILIVTKVFYFVVIVLFYCFVFCKSRPIFN